MTCHPSLTDSVSKPSSSRIRARKHAAGSKASQTTANFRSPIGALDDTVRPSASAATILMPNRAFP